MSGDRAAHHAGHLAADAAARGGGVGADEVVRRLHGHHVQGHAQLVSAHLGHLRGRHRHSHQERLLWDWGKRQLGKNHLSICIWESGIDSGTQAL